MDVRCISNIPSEQLVVRLKEVRREIKVLQVEEEAISKELKSRMEVNTRVNTSREDGRIVIASKRAYCNPQPWMYQRLVQASYKEVFGEAFSWKHLATFLYGILEKGYQLQLDIEQQMKENSRLMVR
jgi:hypothetical protein